VNPTRAPERDRAEMPCVGEDPTGRFRAMEGRTRTRIQRSRSDRMIAGVAGGLAHHLDVDPTLIRLAFVALAFAGIGVVLYIVGVIVIPEAPVGEEEPVRTAGEPTDRAMAARVVIGSVLVAIGCLMLVDWVFPIGRFIWPMVLIVLGIGVFATGRRT
jgi:phage shock protein PspC (stress-responsive transcriptional regulator)